jgi:hypothetical protein
LQAEKTQLAKTLETSGTRLGVEWGWMLKGIGYG